jgi:hypothetical protein
MRETLLLLTIPATRAIGEGDGSLISILQFDTTADPSMPVIWAALFTVGRFSVAGWQRVRIPNDPERIQRSAGRTTDCRPGQPPSVCHAR